MVALAAVCTIWGSTYFAIRVALESLPPFTLGGIRFLVAGATLYAVLRARGVAAPKLREWGASAVTGALLLVIGNGAIVVAQRHLSSSVAAIVVATMPLWTVLFGMLWRERPSRAEMLGVLIGFSGVALLNLGGDLAGNGKSAILALFAPVGWALGSILSRRLSLPGGLMTAAT